MSLLTLTLVTVAIVLSFVPAKAADSPTKEQVPDPEIEKLLSAMTIQEKASFVCGNSLFTAAGLKRLGIPPLTLSDGPQGVREELNSYNFKPEGLKDDASTWLPCGIMLAATWNPELGRQYGETLGSEARARHKDIILGPAVNIFRTPLCGRNFEYMGEDPFLTTRMAVGYIQGVQSQGVAACIKHYALNNEEHDRFHMNIEVDDRALREIYLPSFEAGVKEAGVLAIMSAYNKFRGDFCSENPLLLQDILKNEWGFLGMVISDWGAVHDGTKAALAGLDLEMMTKQMHNLSPLVQSGTLSKAALDDKVRRNLYVRKALGILTQPSTTSGAFNTPEHQAIARKVAQEGIVLLKNEAGLLPLDSTRVKTIAVIGPNADQKLAYGGGSSEIKALYEITPLEGLRKRAGGNVSISYTSGIAPKGQDEAIARSEAVEAARKADVVIFVGGLDHRFDVEGADRGNMNFPAAQVELILAVTAVNPHIIVVLNGSGPVEMDTWLDKVPALLQLWYAGMEGGDALADVIFGDVNPSGKLPVTFGKQLKDYPSHAFGPEGYPGINGTMTYKEGVFVGYRWFDKQKNEPQFPFGHGLSYTIFKYSGLKVAKQGENVIVNFTITNTGKVAGAEVAQIYVGEPKPPVERPERELKGFRKIFLKPGETQLVEIALNQRAFAFWDVTSHGWKVAPGDFIIEAGSSSRDIRLNATVTE